MGAQAGQKQEDQKKQQSRTKGSPVGGGYQTTGQSPVAAPTGTPTPAASPGPYKPSSTTLDAPFQRPGGQVAQGGASPQVPDNQRIGNTQIVPPGTVDTGVNTKKTTPAPASDVKKGAEKAAPSQEDQQKVLVKQQYDMLVKSGWPEGVSYPFPGFPPVPGKGPFNPDELNDYQKKQIGAWMDKQNLAPGQKEAMAKYLRVNPASEVDQPTGFKKYNYKPIPETPIGYSSYGQYAQHEADQRKMAEAIALDEERYKHFDREASRRKGLFGEIGSLMAAREQLRDEHPYGSYDGDFFNQQVNRAIAQQQALQGGYNIQGPSYDAYSAPNSIYSIEGPPGSLYSSKRPQGGGGAVNAATPSIDWKGF